MLTYMVFHKALFLGIYCSLFIFFLLNQLFTNIPIFTITFMPMIYRYIRNFLVLWNYSDYDMIQMSMFNCITDLTEWFSHNSLSLNMTKTYIIIFSRHSSPLSITHPFLLSVCTIFLQLRNL